MMYDQVGAWSGSSVMDGKSFAKDGHCHRENRHASRREFLATASAACTGATFAMPDRAGNRDRFAPDGVEAKFRRLYYDTANATHPSSMAALTALIPMSQITYGSDYPYYPLNQIIRSIKLRICDERCRRKISPQFPVAMLRGCCRASA